MAIIVDMPRLSDTMEEGTIAGWLKAVGAEVKAGDGLAEIETDKAVMVFESFDKGVLLSILLNVGDTVPLGTPIAILGKAGEDISAVARMLGVVDFANGFTPRVPPHAAYFPNIDLTAHLFRAPESEWTGFDTTVSFGPRGHGLTHSILHDLRGPLGTVQQTLTVRPRA